MSEAAPSVTTAALAKHASLFKAQLDGSLFALLGTARTARGAATTNDGLETSLAKAIRAQLDRGISLDAVIEQLAGSLATQVAALLGTSTQSATEQLKSAFTKALSATGQGPPGETNATRAAALATRFGRLTELAARVMNGDTRAPIRSIAGTSLDADTAGADPTASTPTAGAVPTAAVAASLPPPPAPGDGRVVAIAPTQALSSGGDSLLGRMLARAWLAGDNVAPPAPVALSKAPAHAVTAGESATNVAGDPAPSNAPVNAVDAFVKAFTAALAREDARDPHAVEPSSANAAAPPEAPPSANRQSAATSSNAAGTPLAIPVAHDPTPAAAPAAPLSPQQTPQVDPQAVVDQVVRAMTIRTADGTSTVRLRLVPEHLGDVSVKLVVSGGSVDATMTAHSAEAQSALAGAQTQLAKTLADAGLRLASFSVGLASGGSASGGDQSSRQRSGPESSLRRIAAVTSDGGADASDELELLAMPSFGPPVYTPSGGLGALNYLA